MLRHSKSVGTIQSGYLKSTDIGKPIILEWQDAMAESGDMLIKDIIDSLPQRKSVGFLIYIDEVEIRLVGTDDRHNSSSEDVSDLLRVPTSLIRKIVLLEEKRKLTPSLSAAVKRSFSPSGVNHGKKRQKKV